MKTATGKKWIIRTVICLGAVGVLFGALCVLRDHDQKNYVTYVNTAAKGIYAIVSNYMEEQNTLPDGVYTGIFDPDAQECRINATDNQASLTIPCAGWKTSKKAFYIMEIKDGKVIRTAASRSDCLQTDSLEPEFRDNTPFQLSLAEYYLNKYVGHYPVTVAQSP